jgi:hypothetical protein
VIQEGSCLAALQAEVPFAPSTSGRMAGKPGDYQETGSWAPKDEVLAESSRPSVALHRAIALASNSSSENVGSCRGVVQLWTGLLARDLVGCNLLRHREQEFSVPFRCPG